jgi:hypothetical protein
VFNATFSNISAISWRPVLVAEEAGVTVENKQGSSWSWSHGRWIYNYLCNQCLSPIKLWVRIPFRRCVFDTTLCDKVYSVSSTNKTDRGYIIEILLVNLTTIRSRSRRLLYGTINDTLTWAFGLFPNVSFMFFSNK